MPVRVSAICPGIPEWAARTTGLFGRRDDTVALDELERVVY